MMYMKISLIVLVCLGNKLNAQSVSNTVSLGNFKTISGKKITDCTIGYSTSGKLNAAKSNVVLWPTWITAKSKETCDVIVPSLMDTAGFYIVVVDAFGNGISSSPSNNRSVSEVTIRDMVNSQYELLTKHLSINHVNAVMGGSMGGFQVLEWLVSYPGFADKAVSIIGSPKLSTYDLMLWKTEAALLNMLAADEKSKELAMRMVSNINLLNSFSPSYWLHSAKQQKVDSIMLARQTDLLKKTKPEDYLCQVNAIITQDIYQSSGKTIADMKEYIKAKTLIIVSKSDHLVNPQSSIDLAKAIGATLLELNTDCGHSGALCDRPLVKETVTRFLRQ
jgi:homoserine O-acetyltransferase/O-succinyltransferase